MSLALIITVFIIYGMMFDDEIIPWENDIFE